MRTIKFRGISVDTNKWVFGSLVLPNTGSNHAYIYNNAGVEFSGSLAEWEVIPETVGQFTGLLDRNGKEIYEGDKTYWGVIIWNNEKSLFAEHFYQEAIQKWSISSYPISVDRMEIIGNIHENPDLT